MDSVSNISFRRFTPDVIVFVAQVFLLFLVVTTSLVNLSLNVSNTNLWTMILVSCLGYMLPHPRLKKRKGKLTSTGEASVNIVSTGDGDVLRDLAIERTQPVP